MIKYYHPIPDMGSLDWLWFKPEQVLDYDELHPPGFNYYKCYRCNVNWRDYSDKTSLPPKCFSCGRFQKKGNRYI